MSELNDKLNQLMNDPEEFSRIMSMVGTLMNNLPAEPAENSEADENAPEKPPDAPVKSVPEESSSAALAAALPMLLRISSGGGEFKDERSRQKLRLLIAMKPFLDDTHKHDIDRAISIAKAADTAQSALRQYGKGGGGRV